MELVLPRRKAEPVGLCQFRLCEFCFWSAHSITISHITVFEGRIDVGQPLEYFGPARARTADFLPWDIPICNTFFRGRRTYLLGAMFVIV